MILIAPRCPMDVVTPRATQNQPKSRHDPQDVPKDHVGIRLHKSLASDSHTSIGFPAAVHKDPWMASRNFRLFIYPSSSDT